MRVYGVIDMAKPSVNNEIDNGLSVFAKITGPDQDGGATQFGEFLRFGDALLKCLKVTETAVTDSAPAIRYEIAEMKAASAAVTLQPVRPKKGPDARKEVAGLFLATVAAFQSGAPIDSRLRTAEALDAYRKLAMPIERESKVEIGTTFLTTEYIANVDKVLGQANESVGSVTGHLDGINVHNRTECSLYPISTEQRIACTFPEELFGQISAGLRKTVTVYGTQYFYGDTAFPGRVHIEEIEIHPPDSELPTLHQVRDLGPWGLNGLSAVEFVRAIRGEA